jgi:hypothetical protein
VLDDCELGVPLMARHYATGRKVTGSRPDKVNNFFSIYLILPTALDPAPNRNEYQKLTT